MLQALIVYALVAIAAAWIVWSMFLRGWLRRRAAAKADARGGPGCACGD